MRLVKDEPKEARIARAVLRKGAANARERGAYVIEKNDAVQIDGTLYNLQNAHTLERSYKDALMTNTMFQKGKKDVPERGRSRPTPPHCERETEKWIAFYTKQSTYSSFHDTPVTYRGVPYKTLEHGYQGTHGLECNDMEAYKDILKAPTAAKAKEIGGEIPYNEHWEKIKGPHMEDLQYAKYSQHPELADKLCKTVGKTRIEATKDCNWGAGVTIENPALDKQRFGGRKKLGKRIGNA